MTSAPPGAPKNDVGGDVEIAATGGVADGLPWASTTAATAGVDEVANAGPVTAVAKKSDTEYEPGSAAVAPPTAPNPAPTLVRPLGTDGGAVAGCSAGVSGAEPDDPDVPASLPNESPSARCDDVDTMLLFSADVAADDASVPNGTPCVASAAVVATVEGALVAGGAALGAPCNGRVTPLAV